MIPCHTRLIKGPFSKRDSIMSSEEVVLCAVSTDSALKSQVSWELVGWSGITVSTDTVVTRLPSSSLGCSPWSVREWSQRKRECLPGLHRGAVNTADQKHPDGQQVFVPQSAFRTLRRHCCEQHPCVIRDLELVGLRQGSREGGPCSLPGTQEDWASARTKTWGRMKVERLGDRHCVWI